MDFALIEMVLFLHPPLSSLFLWLSLLISRAHGKIKNGIILYTAKNENKEILFLYVFRNMEYLKGNVSNFVSFFF